ncbi:PDZ and LIM domain protein 5 isoform X6 [Prinia subflava]|uniref:PDZ and LIM domain protein 5 isoform X6 n=1 Tax=Prinia subflava TaxID=208062 RepID=UPI002FE215E5
MSNYSVSLVGPAPWGFRLQGGKDFNVPLSISRLNDGGKAAQAQVGIGDVVLTIDGISTDGMTHLEAQNKIKACTGNLNMTLQRVSSIQKPDHFHVTKAEPTEVVKPVPIASAVAPKVTATASVAFNKTPRPFGAVTSSKVTSIPSPSSAFTPAQASAGSPCAVPGVHANAKPNAEPWPPVLGAPKPAVPVPRQHGAASAADGAPDAAEGPRRGGRENQGESKQQNGPPRKHIVDTYTEFYHTPTHSDASKKRLIEDTEDWHPRTGTTQSRSFRILAQITGTDHMKEPENEAGKKTKKRQTENGDFSENNARPEPAAALLPTADSCPGSVSSPRLSEHIAAPAPVRKITVPAPDAASSLLADETPPVPKTCAVATQTTEFPLPADPAGELPSSALHVGTALGLPPALARYEASLPTCETNSFNKISSFQSKSSVSHTSFCAAKVMLEDSSGNLPILGPSPPPVISPFEQRSKIKSIAAAAVSAAIAVRARLHEPSAYRSLLDALLITPVAKPPLQASAPSRKSTSALELPKSKRYCPGVVCAWHLGITGS